MGIIGNFSVYGLMIIPLALLIRGRSITISRLLVLMAVMTALQFAESILRATAAGVGDAKTALLAVDAILIPVIEGHFFSFILRDSKAIKTFRLEESIAEARYDVNEKRSRSSGGDIAASAAVAWCLCYVLFFRVGEWYRTMASLGYEAGNLVAGVEAFAQLLTILTLCRVLTECKAAYVSLVLCLYVAMQAVAVLADSVLGVNPSAKIGLAMGMYIIGPTAASLAAQRH